MLCSLGILSSNLSKDLLRESRNYLGWFYAKQPNQLQANNAAEGGAESKVMDVHEEYRNYPYQPPTLTADQQQQITNRRRLGVDDTNKSYPYEYINSFVRFQEPILPPKDFFCSSLTEQDISKTDYTHVERLFNNFDMTSLGDYHNFYLLINALLLVHVFKNFKDVCLQHYGLDPADNYIFPGLSWEAALKMTDVELDLLTDINQHLFIKEDFKEGVAMTSHQYAQANAPVIKDFDASERNIYIMYLHVNNLYGWAGKWKN